MNTQERAEVLAQNLRDCGHDDITYLDLLDCLASTGLRLAPDTAAESSNAYLVELSVTKEQL